MSVVFAGLTPHPPLLIPEIGHKDRDSISLTDQAMVKLASYLFNQKPDVLVMISPHGPVFSDAIAILHKPVLHGDFGQFGASQVSFEEELDMDFISEIETEASKLDVMVALMGKREWKQYHIDGNLDHGILVPLYYFREMGLTAPLVPITIGMLPYEDLYRFGAMLAKVSNKLGKKIAIVASGDLSHRLTPQAPAGYNPHGKEFDHFLIKSLNNYDIDSLFEVDSKLIEKAGECGYRPVIMMLGALDGLAVESEVISYEGPFGVGYCVTAFKPTGEKIPSKIDSIYEKRAEKIKGIQKQEHPLVRLAREAIINYVNGEKIKFPVDLSSEMEQRAGVFVSIKKHGQLRGCIGTTAATRKNVAEEVVQNAISASSEDPRFFPIEKDELEDLTISVDVLGEPEPITGLKDLDPICYGVIVRQGYKSGLLLPDLEGINTAEEQVEIAKRKAGIIGEENIQLFRFEVKRYH